MMGLNFLPLWLVLMLSLVLSGCGEDINQYKEKVQQDNNNPTGNKAMCLAVGHISQAMYPYTIKYIEGDLENAPYYSASSDGQLKLIKGKSGGYVL